jgi:FAD/FMN-containing dehydrogenase
MGPVRSVADLRERHKGPVIAPQDRAFELARGAARVAPEATAFAGREARWNATFINIWEDAGDDEREIESVRSYSRSLALLEIGGGYVNYATESVATDGLETEFGVERFSHLQAVKRRYDPANAFRFNHNIVPD